MFTTSLVHGWRAWKSARGIAILAIAALAIGIGSTTAIFTVVHAVLLNPLPYTNPDRYYNVFFAWRAHPGWWSTTSYPDYLDYASQLRTVDAYGCNSTGNVNVSLNGQAVHVTGTQAAPALLQSLGISPEMGRWFDAGRDGLKVAVISDGLWRRFGADPAILGKNITVDSQPYAVLGVMPGWFRYPLDEPANALWIPLNPDTNERKDRAGHYLRCVVKLLSTGTPQQALQDFSRILAGLQSRYPGQAEPDFPVISPLLDVVVDQIRPSLVLLLAAASALFLIACANVAKVLLARSVARSRDTAVRVALGATAWQLGIQYFTEGLLVSLAGTALGSFLSYALIRILLSLAADDIPRSDQIALNWQALCFALALAVGCAVFFSLSPLWQARRIAPNEVLSEGTRASAGARSRSLLRIFVIAEVALAFGLLTIGGIIFQNLSGLYQVHPGFDPSRLLIMHLYVPRSKYQTLDARVNYQSRLIEAVNRLPGVQTVGFIDLMPLLGWGDNTVMRVEGRPMLKDWLQGEAIEVRVVSPDYFQTMRIPLLSGRASWQTPTRTAPCFPSLSIRRSRIYIGRARTRSAHTSAFLALTSVYRWLASSATPEMSASPALLGLSSIFLRAAFHLPM